MTVAAPNARRTKLVVAFAIIYLVWGSTYLVTKIGVGHLPPLTFAAARFVSGGLLLLVVARWLALRRGQALWPTITLVDARALLAVGFFGVFIANGTGVWGLQFIPSNLAALLNVSASFWIPLLGLFGARATSISLRIGVGLVIGFAGTVLIAWPGSDAAAAATWPTLIVLVGCFSWSVATILQRNQQSSLDLMTFTALQMLCGGLLLSCVMWLSGEPARWHWNTSGLAALAYMTLMSSCIAYTAYAWLSVNVTPAQLSTYGFVNPAIALLLGWWILDETLGPLQMVGTLVILGGTLLVNWPRPAPALAPAPAAITAIAGAAEAPLSSAKREAPPAT